MTRILSQGPHVVRFATSRDDVAAVHDLRSQCFRNGRPDVDTFDERALHVMVETAGALRGAFRILPFAQGPDIIDSYSAQFYDLTRLSGLAGPMLEMGRLCTRSPDVDPDVLRLSWGAVTRLVDERGIRFVFGCVSFPGADPSRHAGALAHLRKIALAPLQWAPGRRGEVVELPYATRPAPLPPLLRSYLMLGGRVSDHAVIDRDLDTVHVFTGLDIAQVPPARARALRAISGSAGE